MTRSHPIRQAFASRGLAGVATVGSGLLLPSVTGHVAGREAFATFMALNVLVGLSAAFARFGLGHLSLSMPFDRGPSVIAEAWSLRIVVGLAGAITTWIASSFTLEVSLWEGVLIAWLAGTEAIRLLASELLLAERQFRRSLLASYPIRPGITAALLVPGAVLGWHVTLVELLVISLAVSILGTWVAMHGYFPEARVAPTWSLIRAGSPFLLFQAASMVLARGDVWLAGAVLGARGAPDFIAASTLAFQIGIVSRIASESLSPFVSSMLDTDARPRLEILIRRTSTLVAGLTAILCSVTLLLPDPILEAYFGFAWAAGSTTLTVLILATAAMSLLGPGPYILTLVGRQRQAASVQAVAAGALLLAVLISASSPLELAAVVSGIRIAVSGEAARRLRQTEDIVVLPYLWPRMAWRVP